MKNIIMSKDLPTINTETRIVGVVTEDIEKEVISKKIPTKMLILSLESDLSSPETLHGGGHPLPNMNVFIETLYNNNIDENSEILLLNLSNLGVTARCWWMMKSVNIKSVRIFQGNLKKIITSNFDFNGKKAINKTSLKFDKSLIRDRDYIIRNLHSDKLLLIDSRDPISFKYPPGHIPGAINLTYSELLKSNFPSIREISNFFSSLPKNKEIILYCGSGILATLNALLLNEINISSKIYIGSMSDWLSYKDSPLE